MSGAGGPRPDQALNQPYHLVRIDRLGDKAIGRRNLALAGVETLRGLRIAAARLDGRALAGPQLQVFLGVENEGVHFQGRQVTLLHSHGGVAYLAFDDLCGCRAAHVETK